MDDRICNGLEGYLTVGGGEVHCMYIVTICLRQNDWEKKISKKVLNTKKNQVGVMLYSEYFQNWHKIQTKIHKAKIHTVAGLNIKHSQYHIMF